MSHPGRWHLLCFGVPQHGDADLGWLLVLGIRLCWYGYRIVGVVLIVAGALPLLISLLKDRRQAKARVEDDRFRSGLEAGIRMDRERQRRRFSQMTVRDLRQELVRQAVAFEEKHGTLYGAIDKKERLRQQVIAALDDQLAWEKANGVRRNGLLREGLNEEVVIYDYRAADWTQADPAGK